MAIIEALWIPLQLQSLAMCVVVVLLNALVHLLYITVVKIVKHLL